MKEKNAQKQNNRKENKIIRKEKSNETITLQINEHKK